jgi:hypothetical protein
MTVEKRKRKKMSFEEVVIPVEAGPSTKKKRKSPEADDDLEKLKNEARPLCTDSEEWGKVSRYKKPKLESWLRDKKFMLDRRTSTEVTKKGVHLVSGLIDRVTKGQGYVQEALCSDHELHDALMIEFGPFVKLLDNKVRILFYVLSDVLRGLGRRPVSHAFVEEEKTTEDVVSPQGFTAADPTVREEIRAQETAVSTPPDPAIQHFDSPRTSRVGKNQQDGENVEQRMAGSVRPGDFREPDVQVPEETV